MDNEKMQKGLKRMLVEIKDEVAYTRSFIGRDKFADKVMGVMGKVPRNKFVPEHLQAFAFDNGPLPIGHDQTISQPYIVALMTDLLELEDNHVVLEVGTGSGYQTAILSELCNKVYSIEYVPALGEAAAQRLKELHYDNIETRVGNGYHGWPEHAPYDGIIVTAAASHIPPALVEQLKPGGRLVIPVGLPYMHQELMVVEKDHKGETRTRDILAVAFVPLLDEKAKADEELEKEDKK